ncbi:MAG: hypothetical protein J6R29_01910 [Clostridia bacterium]|nr:hypothetical protein [Clostridia bacterium]
MPLYEDKLNVQNANKQEKELDVITQSLFDGGNVIDMPYAEPKKHKISYDVLYEGKLKEEKLAIETHAKINDSLDVAEEVLFKAGIEELTFEDDAEILEETLTFKEPVKPDYVSEEVLFSESNEQLSFDNLSIVSDVSHSKNESSIDDGLDANNSQLSFDDLDINVSLDESDDDFETPKIVYTKKSFAEKMFDCDPIILERYDELKNLLLIYKKVKSRISNTCDTFKFGGTQLAKISTSGKSLKLYLNLEMNEVESRLKCKEAGHKKAYEEVPVFLRIRSPRSMKNAKYLINQLATKYNLVENPKSVLVNSVELLKEKLD